MICDLLLSLGLIILLFYSIFSIFIFNKREILLFMYDVRYEFLKDITPRNEANDIKQGYDNNI